ncbi:MAG: hypothetical protein ACI9PY_001275 [Ascidiaceihabitans sp.]|jgi:hypothetical protein
MRPVLHSDLTAAARVLLLEPEIKRSEIVSKMMQEAQYADRYTRRLGKPHPQWGNGTLAAAAQKYVMADEPSMDSSEYCKCLTLVLGSLVARRTVDTIR